MQHSPPGFGPTHNPSGSPDASSSSNNDGPGAPVTPNVTPSNNSSSSSGIGSFLRSFWGGAVTQDPAPAPPAPAAQLAPAPAAPGRFILYQVPMNWQFFAEGRPVDLNCGRYCAAAALQVAFVKFAKKTAPDDVFHTMLPDPTEKTWLGVKIGWAPWREGENLFDRVDKPATLSDWITLLEAFGPVIVNGTVGGTDWGLFSIFGHFILIVGANEKKGIFYYKDPLKDGSPILEYDFARANRLFNDGVYVVNPTAVL